MRSEAVDFLDGDWETVYKNWASYLEAQNDMIYSIICEEFGLIGAILLLFIFGLLLWRLCVISMHSTDLSGALLSAGIMGHLAIQVILNIAVVTNTIPNTGITLPFISYGGTSIVFLLGEMGLALNVSRCPEIMFSKINNYCLLENQSSHKINHQCCQPCDHTLSDHNTCRPFTAKFSLDRSNSCHTRCI